MITQVRQSLDYFMLLCMELVLTVQAHFNVNVLEVIMRMQGGKKDRTFKNYSTSAWWILDSRWPTSLLSSQLQQAPVE